MPKNLLQDMVKIKRASREERAPEPNREVPLKEALLNLREEQESPVPPEEKYEKFAEPEAQTAEQSRGKRTRPRYLLWVVAALCVIFFLYSISYLFMKVTVTVNPKIQDVALNKNLSASLPAGGEVLPFDLVVISGEEDRIVETTLERDVSERAEGVVVIYNAFSSAPQRLDIDTRLEGSNGKIYKTKKQLTVPGAQGGTPGSVEVGIYAAEAGEAYNSGPLDFTIFGFKGTPKYSKFYARSKGDIAGGFQGKSPFVSDAEKAALISGMKEALQAKLLQRATDQIPDGIILFKDAVFLDTNENAMEFTSHQDKKVPVKMNGTLYGFLLDEDKLTKKIAEHATVKYDGSPVYIENIRNLTFSLSSKDTTSFGDVKNISFNLKGDTKIIWKVDEGKLVADLLGKPKKDFANILLQYPNIDSADLVISPFWKTTLPDKTKDIKVIVNYPK
jgi:hypothetical protein